MLPRMLDSQIESIKEVIKKNRTKMGLSIEDLATKMNEWSSNNNLEPETQRFDIANLEWVGTGTPFLAFYSCAMDLKLFTQEDIRAALRNGPVSGSNRTGNRGKGGKKKAVAKKSSPKSRKKSGVSRKG